MYELCRFVLEEVRRILNVTLTDLLFKVCENELSDKLPNSKIKISRSATLQDICESVVAFYKGGFMSLICQCHYS